MYSQQNNNDELHENHISGDMLHCDTKFHLLSKSLFMETSSSYGLSSRKSIHVYFLYV